jgi:predicted permease
LNALGLRQPETSESVAWEMEHHIEELTDRLADEGWDREEARQEAERRFGDPARYGPHMRRMETRRKMMERLTVWWQVVRQGSLALGRTVRRQPGFVAAVMLALGLGIGANATMYGIIDRLLLQPPAHIDAPEEVRHVLVQRPNSLRGGTFSQSALTYPDFEDLTEGSGFDVAAYSRARERTIGEGETAIRAQTAYTSAEFFSLLGVEPRMGRFYTPDEDEPGRELLAVISEEFWNRAYGASPDVLGKTIEVDGLDRTIVGVTPRGFTGVHLQPVDLWLSLLPSYIADQGEGCLGSRGCWWVQVVARMASGRALQAVEGEATRLHLNGRAEQVENGRYSKDARIEFAPLIAAAGPHASAESQVAKWLTGVSAIVLLIACANVANLLLARGIRRRKELSVRLAMGEGRSRLVLLTVVETVGLALFGGALALLIALWGGDFVRGSLLPGVSFPDSAVNGRVVAFTLAISVLAGILAAIGPALQSRRLDVARDLTSTSRGSSVGRSGLRSFLTVAQAALCVVLLVGAGLFVRSLDELHELDLGMDLDQLVQVQIEFTQREMDAREQRERYDRALQRAALIPGVEAVAGTAVPLGWSFADALSVPGLDSIPRLPGGGPYQYFVTADYFRTVGLPITRGRGFQPSDREGAERVAVVNETMARTLWPDRPALGQCLMIGSEAETCTSVVGVTQDATRGAYEDETFMGYYLPVEQVDGRTQALYVRTTRAPETISGELSRQLIGSEPGIRYVDVTPMRDILDPQARSWTLGATLFSVFGGLALLLAAIGLYSVLAFEVAQRTRELGIRTALGADRGHLLRRVVTEGVRLTLLGVALGMGIAVMAAPYAADLLFQVSPREPTVLMVVTVVLLGVSLVASLFPALRATRVDPIQALRTD